MQEGETENLNGIEIVRRIHKRLEGYYNLPATRKRPSQRARGSASTSSSRTADDTLHSEVGRPMSVESQVIRLIHEATSLRNLSQMCT
jgi:hypothetical protein